MGLASNQKPSGAKGGRGRRRRLAGISEGVYSIDGRRQVLSSADYPYYRDDPRNWPDRLEKLKAIGCQIVTFYIPWRHHDLLIDGRREIDFTGRTRPNRDVAGFLELCRAAGLKAIAKPGPFIHAETNYGGLPDYVCPLNDARIEPMLRADGRPFTWNGNSLAEDGKTLRPWPLPAPLDPVFLEEVHGWYAAVRKLLAPRLYPRGPIVMIQVANEGIYSNHQRPPWAYDYSRSGIAFFRQFLRERYGSLEAYNRCHAARYRNWDEIEPPRSPACPATLRASLAYADWAAYQAIYMRRIYALLVEFMGLEVPYVVNVNPPTADHFGPDAWLCRVNPEEWAGVHYGFTNWIGVACDDPGVVDRYQLAVKRARGFNLEENWGFSRLYEPAFDHAAVCFYQTLLAIAAGSTGFNVFTGVGTAQADLEIDRLTQGVYPDSAPIDAQGQITPKGRLVALLNRFVRRWGEEFLATRPVQPVAWGLYLPYAHAAVWFPQEERERARRLGLAECGRAVLRFFRQVRQSHLDASLVNLQTVSEQALHHFPFLVLQVGRWMDRATQARLLGYLRAGGRLALIGSGPQLDEDLSACNLLAEAEGEILRLPETALEGNRLMEALFAAGLEPAVRPLNPAAAQAMTWLYTHPQAEVQYVFLLSGREETGPVEFALSLSGQEHRLGLLLPRSGAGVLRIETGKITAALLGGENAYLGETVTPYCCLDGARFQAPRPGDWLLEG